jgi:hypothetical protein
MKDLLEQAYVGVEIPQDVQIASLIPPLTQPTKEKQNG